MKNFKIIKSEKEETDFIDNCIVRYNQTKVPFTQEEPFKNISFCIKDENDSIIVGINALMYCWGVLYIDVLFVDSIYRNKGLGTSLLNYVEQEAKRLGSHLVHLDTFDFQAKDFYLQCGYEVFGVLDDCPKGHKRYYMKKVL